MRNLASETLDRKLREGPVGALSMLWPSSRYLTYSAVPAEPLKASEDLDTPVKIHRRFHELLQLFVT
jgi:hypothetical protein